MKIGSKWNGWTIEKKLGSGSFGTAYKVTKDEFGHHYESALKVISIPQNESEVSSIRSDGMDDRSITVYFQGMVEDITEELALMAKLKGNTNIVSYEDHVVNKKDDRFGWDIYVRMELLNPLNEYVQKHPLTIKEIIRLGIDICKALEVCQKYNIIHRDIKPENIFVSDLGDYKLGDFGIARQIEKTVSTMSKKGTYTYMAPEVYKGNPYDSTVDIYSLGIVLYKFLNNSRTPFLPPYPQTVMYTDKEKANVLRMNGKELPVPKNAKGKLAEIVLKACAFNPSDRYENAGDMRKELEELLCDESEAEYIYNNVNVDSEKDALTENSESDKPDYSATDEKTTYLFREQAEKAAREAAARKLRETEARARLKSEEQARLQAEELARREAEEQAQREAEEKARKKEVNEIKEEKDQDKKAFPKKMLLIIGGAVLAVIIAIVITVVSCSNSNLALVPDVVNHTEKEAIKMLDEAELKHSIKYETSSSVKKGYVIKQSEKADSQIEKGTKIALIVSQGKKLTVPDLVGKTEKEAQELLQKKGLKLIVEKKKYSNKFKKGRIISQATEPNTEVKKGDSVAVIISKGVEMIAVPNVVGLSEEDAKEIITNAKLNYTVSYEYNNAVSKGKVIAQSVPSDQKIKKHTTVNLTVSKGKKATTETSSSTTSNNKSNTNSYTENYTTENTYPTEEPTIETEPVTEEPMPTEEPSETVVTIEE